MSALRNISAGGSSKQKAKAASGQGKTSEKELQKLRRVDLLELLIDQVRENEKLNASVEELSDLSERLKAKLDDKDAQIERLKSKLNDKDAQIEELQEQNRSMAHAVNTFDIDEIMEVQRYALTRYFEHISYDENEVSQEPEQPEEGFAEDMVEPDEDLAEETEEAIEDILDEDDSEEGAEPESESDSELKSDEEEEKSDSEDTDQSESD